MPNKFNAKLTEDEAREFALRERSRSLLSTIAFAMAQEDFAEQECVGYMDTAFEASDGPAYGACAAWLSKRGLISRGRAEALLKKALFAQRPAAMAVLGDSFVFLAEGDGLDADWRAGLAMALLSGDEGATLALARIVLGREGGERLLASAIAESRQLAEYPPDAIWLDDAEKARLEKFSLLAALCEKATLSLSARAGRAGGSTAPSL